MNGKERQGELVSKTSELGMGFSLASDIWWRIPVGTNENILGTWKLGRNTAFSWGNCWRNYYSAAEKVRGA